MSYSSRAMRRIILFLALVLPLQFAWAGAASYCQHETDPAQAQHFGHHVHRHHAGSEKAPGGKLIADNDCGTCHTSGSTVAVDPTSLAITVPVADARVPYQPRPLLAALSRAPDRPQWLRLA